MSFRECKAKNGEHGIRRELRRRRRNIPEPESYPTHPSISLNPDEISIPY
jgi:hypothetical protein